MLKINLCPQVLEKLDKIVSRRNSNYFIFFTFVFYNYYGTTSRSRLHLR